MFSYISQVSKAHLSIQYDKHPFHSHTPDKHVHQEVLIGAPRWHPKEVQISATERAGQEALPRATAIYDVDTLDNSSKHYNSNTKCIDNWTNTEVKLATLPVRKQLAHPIQYSFRKAFQHIQNMLNLHPLLGKPGWSSRAIRKTPMLYRLVLGCRSEVAEWESFMTGSFDTAGKGKLGLLADAGMQLHSPEPLFSLGCLLWS